MTSSDTETQPTQDTTPRLDQGDDEDRDRMAHVWWWRRHLPHRKGQPCRLVATSPGPGPRNVLVEFADGGRVVTSRFAVRRRQSAPDPQP